MQNVSEDLAPFDDWRYVEAVIKRTNDLMNTEGAKAQRRNYTDEFKEGAVARVKAGETVAGVARDIDVHPNVLGTWVKAGPPTEVEGLTNSFPEELTIPKDLSEEISRLRRENLLLRAEIDYLKRREAILSR